MWSYYGSKNKIAKLYPLPKHGLIIEPFSGAAWYSVLHRHKNVLLNEKNEIIHNIWNWLINEATSDLIMEYKDFFVGQDISQIALDKAHKDLIGFCINRGSIAPKNIVQKWSCQVASKPNWASTTAYSLKRVANLLPEIKHWKTQLDDYKNIPNIEATWFIDPPYQRGGEHYKHSKKNIDFTKLGEWSKERLGQIIVCENDGADWMPFIPLKEYWGGMKRSTEVIWSNEKTNYDCKQNLLQF